MPGPGRALHNDGATPRSADEPRAPKGPRLAGGGRREDVRERLGVARDS